MNISPISNTNICRNNNNNNKVSFTSVIPFKVFIDGKPSVDSKNIGKAVRGLATILTHSAADEKLKIIKRIFMTMDVDFRAPDGVLPNGEVIRNHVFDGVSYLFTGFHSRKLDELGRKIGPEKRKGLENLGTTDTHETNVAVKDYFKKIVEFITSPEGRLRAFVNPTTRAYEGDELGLHIMTKSNGRYGKRDFKLEIENIAFRKIVKPSSVKPSEVKPPEVKPSVPGTSSTAPTHEAPLRNPVQPKATSIVPKRRYFGAEWPAVPQGKSPAKPKKTKPDAPGQGQLL